MKQTFISVVVPTYNDSHLLEKCLNSLSLQKYQNYEVIVVDNNSLHPPAKLVKEFGPNFRFLKEKQQGIVFARNKGFDNAKGEILARLDADSIVKDNWLQTINSLSKKRHHALWAMTGPGSFYNAKYQSIHHYVHGSVYYLANRIILGHYLLWGSNMAISKQSWLAVRDEVCPQNNLHEDMDLSAHLHAHGIKISYERNLKAQMLLKRMDSSPVVLWKYLMMWARSVQYHNTIAGLLCYPLAFLVFIFGITVGPIMVWLESGSA